MRRFVALRTGIAGLAMLLAGLTVPAFGGDASEGKELFQRRCGGCHALDAEKVGPRLRGVFGRPAASIQTYSYSEAVKSSHITWDETTLDRWMAEPDSVIADSDMSFRLENGRERAAIIEYLKHLDPR